MYEQDYQYSPIDTSQEYNVELKKTSKNDSCSTKVFIIFLVLCCPFMIFAFPIKDAVFFLLYSLFLIVGLYLSLKSDKRDAKTYFIITKDGIDFCEASFSKGNTQRQMSWSEIDHIEIFPVYYRRSIGPWYRMKVFDTYDGPYINVYTFSPGRSLEPEKMVKVLKAYSSGNVKIKVEIQKMFSTKTEWH